jgi:NADH-quinone oxidoreductase E subunit
MSESFKFNDENLAKAKKIIARYPEGRQQSAVLPLLDLAQRQNGNFASDGVIDAVAAVLGMARIRVMEVASFYTMVNRKPVGKYHLQCCTTTPCWLRGSSEVVDAMKKHLGIGFGEVTKDGLFSMLEVECIGACVNAPVVQINDDFYEDLDAASVVKILKALQAGETPRPGPQIDRQTSAPVGGATTLKNIATAKG